MKMCPTYMILRTWSALTRTLIRTLDRRLPEDVASAWFEAAWAVEDWRSRKNQQ
jgi:hypothetical protein